MEKGLRYKILHMGDYMVDLIDKVSDAAKASAKGVILTYDIRDLRGKKNDILLRLGKRLTECRNLDHGVFVSRDEELTRLFEEFDDVAGRTEALLKDRNQRLYPSTSACSGEEAGVDQTSPYVHSTDELKGAVDVTLAVEVVSEPIVISEPFETAAEDVITESADASAGDIISEPVIGSIVAGDKNDDQAQDDYTQNEGV
ncbi:MAG: hypothetical protein HQL06_03085 [Nitrospirae bacterium]|uniref:Magnetosome protein Mad10 n=1 Tax=uncultured Nitrospirota bacterium TaxID=170969 RepID=A0A142BTW5_9BACT|nr:magnetosome protein Mad10 [uncultured Nitrospirota bacterium]MBF0343192.1 hypothetical protein [Nitrospirota bacterium]